MLEMSMRIFGIVAPVILVPLFSYGWVRSGKDFDTRFTSDISIFIATPCLIFSSLTEADLPFTEVKDMAWAITVAIGFFYILGFVFLKVARLSVQTHLNNIALANMGNIGLPICYFAFGSAGLALAAICMVVMLLYTFSLGVLVVGGKGAWLDLFRLPSVYAIGLAIVFMVTDMAVPAWLANTTSLIGGLALPMILLTLGAAIAKMHVTNTGTSMYVTVLRFALGGGVGWSVGVWLDLSPMAHSVLILECIMPVAVYNYILAQRYAFGEMETASVVLLSTVVSFALLPAALWLLLSP